MANVATAPGVDRRPRRRRRKIAFGCLGIGGFIVLLVAGVVGFLLIREWRSPGGAVFVQTPKGRIQLQIPGVGNDPAPTASPNQGFAKAGGLPPTGIDIARIGVRAKVYLMTEQPPKAPAVGWIFGTAMPGGVGNMVFYGARAGPYAVFQALDQLRPGDEITVTTGDYAFTYDVTSLEEVSADDTEVVLPTKDAEITLITDAGSWDQSAGRYTKRLVVHGRYVGAQPWSGK